MGTVLGTLADLGYLDLSYRVLDAKFFGVPQRRRRVVIVGRLGDGHRSREVLLEPESSGGHLAAGTAAGEEAPANVEDGAGIPRLAVTLTAGVSSPGVNPPGRRKKDDFNLVPEVATALTIRCGNAQDDAQLGQLVTAYSIYPESGQGADLRATELTGPVPALTAVAQAQQTDRTFLAAPLDLRNVTRRSGTTGIGTPSAGIGDEGNPAFTVTSAIAPAVAFRKVQRAHHSEDCERWNAAAEIDTLDANGHTARTATAVVEREQGTTAERKGVTQGLAVRRLTPRECERLQGFPDDWTEVPNEQGKPAADSHRYKQAGNAVAVPVFAWVFKRLASLGVS